MSRLLTDEAIIILSIAVGMKRGDGLADNVSADLLTYLKAQDAKTDPLSREDERRKMAEWLETMRNKEALFLIPDVWLDSLREGRAPWDSPTGHATEAGAGGSTVETHRCYYCSYEGTDVNRIATLHDIPSQSPYCCDDGDACNARIKEAA